MRSLGFDWALFISPSLLKADTTQPELSSSEGVEYKFRGISVGFLKTYLDEKLSAAGESPPKDFYALMEYTGGILDKTESQSKCSLWSLVPKEHRGQPEIFLSHT